MLLRRLSFSRIQLLVRSRALGQGLVFIGNWGFCWIVLGTTGGASVQEGKDKYRRHFEDSAGGISEPAQWAILFQLKIKMYEGRIQNLCSSWSYYGNREPRVAVRRGAWRFEMLALGEAWWGSNSPAQFHAKKTHGPLHRATCPFDHSSADESLSFNGIHLSRMACRVATCADSWHDP
jgi:hypothetical protein